MVLTLLIQVLLANCLLLFYI